MAQQAWQSGNGERRWLLRLVDAMERVSRRETRTYDPNMLVALRLQLARPASANPYWYVRQTSHFGVRH
jgi:hypothetical protein